MDDTLFDHSMTCRAALTALRREHPFLRRVPLVEQWRSYAELLWTTHTEVQLGHRTIEDARRERFVLLSRRAGRRVSLEDAEDLSEAYREHYQRLRRAVPGAPEAVRALHRTARVGIVTNNTRAEQQGKLAFLGLEDDIDFLIASADLGVAKPHPSIFRAALAEAGTAAPTAVMVGDSWSSDVEGARAVGIRAVWFNRFRLPRPEGVEVAEFASFRPIQRLGRLLRAPTGIGGAP
jgi:HAD superfamily hydrolase (TIGR01549 family)